MMLALSASLAGAGWYTGFFAAHNDFWGAVFIAQQMNAGVRESFHNGFFPLGYPLLLKSYPDMLPLDVWGFLTSFASAVVVLVASWFLAKRLMPRGLAWLLLPFIAFHPLCFFYFTTAGVDPGAMAFFLAGMALLLHAAERAVEGTAGGTERAPSGRGAFKAAMAAGILIGLGGLWRYHALIAGLILVVSVALAYRRIAIPLVAALFIAVAYSPQALINLSLGLSPLHTNYELAVYDLMHDVNWHALGDIAVQPTMLQVLLSDPALFLRQYARGVASLMIYALPALVLVVMTRDPAHKRRATSLGLFLVGYALVFGLSVGGRAPLLVLPLALISCGAVLSAVFDLRRARAGAGTTGVVRGVAAFLAMVFVIFVVKDARALKARVAQAATYRAVERHLIDAGVRDAREVFTTDFDLYFRTIPPYRPRYNGGWGLFGTYRWREEFPQAPTGDLEAFIADNRAHGRRFVILSPQAGKVASFLDEAHTAFAPRSGLVPVRRIGHLSIFVVTESL